MRGAGKGAAWALALVIACAWAALPSTATAQERLNAGLAVLHHDGYDVRGVGAYLSFPVAMEGRLSANPSGAMFLLEDEDVMEFNADVTYGAPVAGGLRVLALGGLNVSFDTVKETLSLAPNAGGVLELRVWRIIPAVGAKIELREGSPVVFFARLGLAVDR